MTDERKPHVYEVEYPYTSSPQKELLFLTPCQEHCGGQLSVRDDECPHCHWPAVWPNSTWRKKQQRKALADAKAKERGAISAAARTLSAWAEMFSPVPGPISLKPDEAQKLTTFVARNGPQALADLLWDCKGEGGRGLVVHILNKLSYWKPRADNTAPVNKAAATTEKEVVFVESTRH